MRVSIHQPQYLPWVPYFTKMLKSDVFVFLDSVAFQKNGVQNRNQIKTASGAQWLTVPVKHKLGQSIMNTQLATTFDWRRKHKVSIFQNYSKAPFFRVYEKKFDAIYDRDWDNLCELNIESTKVLLELLGISVNLLRSSDLDVTGSGSELIKNICTRLGADTYISGVGGRQYLDHKDFEDSGIDVYYLAPEFPREYDQSYRKAGFINNLSAIDILFNCGVGWKDFVK